MKLALILIGLCFTSARASNDDWRVTDLHDGTTKNRTQHMSEVFHPHQDPDACMIYATLSPEYYNFFHRFLYYFGIESTSFGTGTVINEHGILTTAHTFLTVNRFSVLKNGKHITRIWKPRKIFRGYTTDAQGNKIYIKSCGHNSSNSYLSAAMLIHEDFMEEGNFHDVLTKTHFKKHDLAMIRGTGMENDGGKRVVDRIQEMGESLVHGSCYHYPEETLPQKHSSGFVDLGTNCSNIPLMHHDLISKEGSSGAGIFNEKKQIFAVLRGAHRDFWLSEIRNDCTLVDQCVISKLKLNVLMGDRIKFSGLTAFSLAALLHFDAFALGGHDDHPNPCGKPGTQKLSIYKNVLGYTVHETEEGKYITKNGRGYFVSRHKFSLRAQGMFPKKMVFPRHAILPLAGSLPAYWLINHFWNKENHQQ